MSQIVPGNARARVLAGASSRTRIFLRCAKTANLPQRRRFVMAALQLKHHPFDVLVVLVRL
jgi:hypothetical protein